MLACGPTLWENLCVDRLQSPPRQPPPLRAVREARGACRFGRRRGGQPFRPASSRGSSVGSRGFQLRPSFGLLAPLASRNWLAFSGRMPVPEPLVYTVTELQQVLRVGRHTARSIAGEIGVRLSPRRVVIPRARLERWLARDIPASTTPGASRSGGGAP